MEATKAASTRKAAPVFDSLNAKGDGRTDARMDERIGSMDGWKDRRMGGSETDGEGWMEVRRKDGGMVERMERIDDERSR